MRRALLPTLLALALSVPATAHAAPPTVGGISFNDAPLLGPGSYSDSLDSGGAVFYKVRLAANQRLSAAATLDMSGLDPSLTGTSSLIVRLYGPLRGKDTEAQQLGPGDPTSHLKATSAELGPVRQPGLYYVSAGVNVFLPQGSETVQLPLNLTIGVSTSAPAHAQPVKPKAKGDETTWTLAVALGAIGLLAGIAGGLTFRRRYSARA
ncbi:MAG TPA: hypothetical protein VGI67_01275 [Thermoleophilaceae bacterium]|jgi:hypothetical protein